MNTVIIWYLIMWGYNAEFIQTIPEPSQQVCEQQRTAYDKAYDRYGWGQSHTLCLQGLPR